MSSAEREEMSNDDKSASGNGIDSQSAGGSLPAPDVETRPDAGGIEAANLVNDPPTDTTVMLPCMHWGTVSHKTGDRLYRCQCGQEAIVRAVQRTVTKYVVADRHIQPSLLEQLESD